MVANPSPLSLTQNGLCDENQTPQGLPRPGWVYNASPGMSETRLSCTKLLPGAGAASKGVDVVATMNATGGSIHVRRAHFSIRIKRPRQINRPGESISGHRRGCHWAVEELSRKCQRLRQHAQTTHNVTDL